MARVTLVLVFRQLGTEYNGLSKLGADYHQFVLQCDVQRLAPQPLPSRKILECSLFPFNLKLLRYTALPVQ